MERTLIRDLGSQAGKKVLVQAWIHRIRELGGISFVVLRDRSGMAQLVQQGAVGLHPESVVAVSGTVSKNEKAPGGYELTDGTLELIAEAAGDLPIPVNQDPDKIGLEAILDHRMISIRNPKIRSVFTLQSAICQYFAEYLRTKDFTEIKTSKLIGSGTEGGTGLFQVEYFDTKVFLAQSPQFYKQAMVSSGMERVFEIGAAYRAEKHDTPRHLNEYVSLDVEMGFIQDEHDLIDLEIGILSHIFGRIKAEHQEILDLWGADVPTSEQVAGAPRIAHEDAKKIVTERTGKRVFEINPEAERVICDWALEEHGVDLVFINEFPRKKRPFYTFPRGLKTMSFDLIFRGLEITTGGKRIHEYPLLLEQLPRFGLIEEGLGGYTDIFKYGCPPHGGFAIGLERLTQKILGLANVKEASLFPRDRRRVKP